MQASVYDLAAQAVQQPDGKILTVGVTNNGNNEDLVLSRYLTNGQLDPSFGNGGKVTLSRPQRPHPRLGNGRQWECHEFCGRGEPPSAPAA